MTGKDRSWTVLEGLFATGALAFVLYLHAAVPFLALPTLGQSLWTAGFSQSFANNALYDLYARDFGIPKPAPIMFGLAGAWPANLLIRAGMLACDAYASVAAFWLGVAFLCAFRIGRVFGTSRFVSLLAALTWLTMPVIWGHAGYSMLSFGMALLSWYFLAALRLFLSDLTGGPGGVRASGNYAIVALFAVFMDGYTFVMFAVGSTMLLIFAVISRKEDRPVLLRRVLPVHLGCFMLAYLLYILYVGRSGFVRESLDFFRGWGLDLSFIALPSRGFHWLADFFGLSVRRSNFLYFGDSSVWTTTFCLPIALAGLFAWWRRRKKTGLVTAVMLIAAFGFYMALGPSLKVNSTKPQALQLSRPGLQSASMPPELALVPTGNAWISMTLPGFNSMRASYRWVALAIFSLWLLVTFAAAHSRGKERWLWLAALLIVAVLNLPDLPETWRSGVDRRTLFSRIDSDLVPKLRSHVPAGATVAFIPWGNDFMVNYLAARTGFRTYNIGGDKNLRRAQTGWPPEMFALAERIDREDATAVTKLLLNGTARILVIPYFHMFWSSHLWPCPDESILVLNREQEKEFRSIPEFVCPSRKREEMLPLVRALQKLPYLEVRQSDLFATIRLSPLISDAKSISDLKSSLLTGITYPVVLDRVSGKDAWVFGEGWYPVEPGHVWSGGKAKLLLPVPRDCSVTTCRIILTFTVFGAGPERPVPVAFRDRTGNWSTSLVSRTQDIQQCILPLKGPDRYREILLSIPRAASPRNLSGLPDDRVLGVALRRIDLDKEP